MTTEATHALIFVYNADSGLFNTMTDIAHKMLSPTTYNCNLCAITHGLLSEKQEWRSFIEHLDVPVEFLHRDEFEKQYGQSLASYPVVLDYDGKDVGPLLSSEAINACQDIACLCQLIEDAIAA